MPAGSEPVRSESPEVPGGAGRAPDPEVPGGAHDPMRDDVDGDEAMVLRVPNLPPEPSARQIAEHELTGHAVYRSWCRNCVASKGRAYAHSSREDGELLEIGIDYGFFGRMYFGMLKKDGKPEDGDCHLEKNLTTSTYCGV